MVAKDVVKALRANGWKHVRTDGSHYQFKHPMKPGTVTVAMHQKDIPIGTLKNIERQSGLSLVRR